MAGVLPRSSGQARSPRPRRRTRRWFPVPVPAPAAEDSVIALALSVHAEADRPLGFDQVAVIEDPDGNAVGIMSPVEPDQRSHTDFGET
jgi:hypothetical protein